MPIAVQLSPTWLLSACPSRCNGIDRADIQSTIEGWQTSRERRDRYQRDLIPLAEVKINVTLTAYRGGKSTLADVLAARRNRLDLQLQALSLDLDVALQWADLTFLFTHSDNQPQDHST
jgi:outer membrane protein TolC